MFFMRDKKEKPLLGALLWYLDETEWVVVRDAAFEDALDVVPCAFHIVEGSGYGVKVNHND
jgi:hypothetical protein